MKIQTIDSNQERQILTAMIVDKTVLGRISTKWQNGMFRNNYANLIAAWCIDYFNKYEKAPMKHIENLFENWAEKNKDKDTITLIEKFLGTLSEDYKQLKKETNSDYIIDLSGKYLNQVKLERLADAIQGDIDSGKVEKAKDRVNTFNQIELGGGEGVNVLQDKEAIKEAFEDKQEPLIVYPKDLGKFFGDAFEREGFISFLAPEKRGKSWLLIDVAYRAMLQRKKVVFFAVGDMSQNQVMRRFMIRVTQRPFYPREVYYPIHMYKDHEDEMATVRYKVRRFTKPLSWRRAMRACRLVMRKKIKSKEPLLKLSCHPNSTLKVKEIKNILKIWERESWIPDVIIIDYADILNMDYAHLEGRERINETWKQMRALSQIYHCLLVTATQSDANSYNTKTMGKMNFSDDKRKFAHVTGMIGINQTNEEKEKGIMRLNWIVRREEEYHENKCIHVAGCLSLGNPLIKSCFEKE